MAKCRGHGADEHERRRFWWSRTRPLVAIERAIVLRFRSCERGKNEVERCRDGLGINENQIIWGGNYFDLPPTRGVIAWDKVQPWYTYSQWEMAWTSFDTPARLFKFDNRTGGKIHATQKPVQLYLWLLSNYANAGDRILDTHLGSGSIALACHDMGFDLEAYEIDKDYFKAASKRLKDHQKQLRLF